MATLLCIVCSPRTPAYANKPAGSDWPDYRPAPADCPSQAQIEQRVEAHLGRPLREAAPSLRLDMRMGFTTSGYRLTVRLQENPVDLLPSDSRTFEGPSCHELAEAAALLIALSVDPLAVPAAPASSAAEPPPVAAAPAAELSPAPLQVVEPRRSVRGALRAAALLDVGYLPRAGAGAELASSVSFGGSRVELSGLWLPGVRSAHAADGARVKIALWALRASYCQQLVASLGDLLALGACGGVELGRASSDGLDVLAAEHARSLWRAGWVALRVSSALTRWLGLSLEPGLAIPFARSRFVSSDADGARRAEVYTARAVSFRLALALEALF